MSRESGCNLDRVYSNGEHFITRKIESFCKIIFSGKNVSKDSVLPSSMAQSATLLPSGAMKLESKESIQEIKELKNNLTQAEARVITQVSSMLISDWLKI